MLLRILIPFTTEAMTCFSCLAADVAGRVAGVVIYMCRYVLLVSAGTLVPMVCFVA